MRLKDLTLAWLVLLSALLFLLAPLKTNAADVNGDFSLDLRVNGQDMLSQQAFTVSGDEMLNFDLTIRDVQVPVVMQRLTVEIFLAGIPVSVISEELNQDINPGDTYRPPIDPINTRDYLSIWGIDIATGKYRAVVRLEYLASGAARSWTQARDVEVPGNPLATVAGMGAAVISGMALGGMLALVKSSVGFNLETQVLSGKKSLEARARSKVSNLIASAAKRLVVKEKCPLCQARLEHGFCPACGQSVKQLQKAYRALVKQLSAQGMELLAAREVESIATIPEAMGIEGELARDVVGTMHNARLLRVKKFGRSLMGAALVSGAASGIAAVLWVTLGGFSVLSTTALTIILALSFVIPWAIARIARMAMSRKYSAGAF